MYLKAFLCALSAKAQFSKSLLSVALGVNFRVGGLIRLVTMGMEVILLVRVSSALRWLSREERFSIFLVSVSGLFTHRVSAASYLSCSPHSTPRPAAKLLYFVIFFLFLF